MFETQKLWIELFYDFENTNLTIFKPLNIKYQWELISNLCINSLIKLLLIDVGHLILYTHLLPLA